VLRRQRRKTKKNPPRKRPHRPFLLSEESGIQPGFFGC